MPKTKKCSSCGTSLANKRSHTRTCSNTCRWRVWQAKQSFRVQVKLMFSKASYELIRGSAEAVGESVNDYLQAQAIAGFK